MPLTPAQLCEHAIAIILDHASDVENLSISEHLEDLELSDEDHNAATDAIDALIKKATITVSWPNDECTHGGDCAVHPDVHALHNFDNIPTA